VLSGSAFLSGVHGPYTEKVSGAGHLVVAMKIEAFQPLDEFNARMERFIDELKSVPRAQGTDEVFYPGEIEARNDARNRGEGLLLPEDTLADLAKIGLRRGLAVPWD
jgi:LDH2 family malate/lactate/ureidoglycolate dehydrogenase